MKKIIAVLLSINLLVLNASPVLAQVAPRKLAQTASKAVRTGKLTPGLKTLTATTALGKRVEQATLNGMRLPLTQNYAALLGNHDPLLPPARKILTHDNTTQRALLLRSDFVALALNQQASAKDVESAAAFYRNNLQKWTVGQETAGTVADIASLGLLGNQKDGELIYQTVQKMQGLPNQALVTAAAARALLRLKAYPQLEALSRTSTVQPQLWEGLARYIEEHKLETYIFGCENGTRHAVDVSAAQKDMSALGPLNQVAVDPSVEATYLYMNAGRGPFPVNTTAQTATSPQVTAEVTQDHSSAAENVTLIPGEGPTQNQPQLRTPVTENLITAPIQTAALAQAEKTAADAAQNQALTQVKALLKKIGPKPFDPTQPANLAQRAALYLTAFSIGLEIGTPIMASIKTALDLPLSYAVLVMAASFSPYLFGSFIANWLKTKIGRKATINTGLALTGGSFAVGATLLGLDGSFTAWNDPLAQYFALLTVLTTASTGCVFIHNAVGPVMTEISHKASELIRQQRGTYIELSRSVGMMASFAFPFVATSMLGMDWSAPFVMALPFVGASALALNTARLPNSKPPLAAKEMKLAQSPLMDGARKARKAMQWKDSILNNGYVRLLREEPGVSNLITALFLMNAVEVAYQSGFLFMIPQLTNAESTQYLLGMVQYAVAFLTGRYLAGHFLKWFPKRNISVATLLAAAGGAASLATTHNAFALTAALFAAEVGISTGFTLAFARTARNHLTQDRITSLIMATAISCAVGPYLLTQVAQGLMDAGILSEGDATITALLAIPSALALYSAHLFRGMENKTVPGLKTGAQRMFAKIKQFFKRK